MLGTGHRGFIGTAFAPEYAQGFDVLNGDDIRNPYAISDCVSQVKPEVIIHLAAISGVEPCMKDPISACGTNVQGSVNVLEAAKQNGSGRVLLASSGAVTAPTHPYAASKRAMEDFGIAYRRWLEVTIL